MAAAAVETLPGPERHVDGLAVPTGIGANQGVIKNEHIQRLRPTPKDTPISEIRKRLKEDGYIFMKGLIPREDVLNVRKQYAFPLLSLSHFLRANAHVLLATSSTGAIPVSSNPEPRRRTASSTPLRTPSTTAASAPATCPSARRRWKL